MKCPHCGYKEDKVVDSRESLDGDHVRRRRECLKCGGRFTTYEYKEDVPLMVVKKDARREAFDRKKILSGLIKACEKRPVSIDKLEEIALAVERAVQKRFEKEVPSEEIGELVMERLAHLDDVAYVRFASVYRQFKDVSQFMQELGSLLNKTKGLSKKKKTKITVR